MPRKRKEIPDGFNEKFPQRLRELIKEKGETQQGLADYIGRTRQLISYYCDGSSSPDWKTLGQIATYFNVTSDYLIGLSDAKQPENTDIVERLGLTEEVIKILAALHIDDLRKEELFLKEKIPNHIKEVDVINRWIVAGFKNILFGFISGVCRKMLDQAQNPARGLYDVPDGMDDKSWDAEIQELIDRASKYDLVLLHEDDRIAYEKHIMEQIYKDVLAETMEPEQGLYHEMLKNRAGEPDGDD